METHFRRVDLPEGGTACQLCSGNTGRVFIERSQQVVCLDCGRDIAQAMSAFDPPKPPESPKDRILRFVGNLLDIDPAFGGSLADFIRKYELGPSTPPETVTASPVEETHVMGHPAVNADGTYGGDPAAPPMPPPNPPSRAAPEAPAPTTAKPKTTSKKAEGWQKRGGKK